MDGIERILTVVEVESYVLQLLRQGHSLVVTFFSGIIPGIVGYVVAWIVMPEEPEYATVPQAQQVTTP